MNKAIDFINEVINLKPFKQNIRVYGWQNEYDHLLIQSVAKLLPAERQQGQSRRFRLRRPA